MSYPKSEYKLIGFEKSKAKGKKYAALLMYPNRFQFRICRNLCTYQ